jgi:cold-inducible RNA-binding protein
MSTNLYVGNLSYNTTEDSLRTLFKEFGEIESVKLITDRYTGRSRGFAFVEMASEQEAQEAISNLNGKSVDGRELRVDKAKPKTDRGQQGGGRRPRW